MKTEQFKLNVFLKNVFSKSSFLIFLLGLVLLFCSDEKVSEELQRDYLTPEISCGTVQFSDGCSPKLDTLISFGIALIHHMTYEDAAYTFNRVIETDKDCFWGYWGKAMSIVHPLWPEVPNSDEMREGDILSQTALNLAKTKKEKLYGAAIAVYFKDALNKTEPERLSAYYNGWQLASQELPEDLEAKLFHVLMMLVTVSPGDKSYDVQREAGAIAEQTLEIIPDHPGGFHYAIHAYDYPPLAPQALRVARNYYKIAPELPHALHMPTHIFTRLGYWTESIDLNLRSADVAILIPVNGQISAQYFHALDYLTYAYLQQSEYEKAKDIATLIDTLNGTFQSSPISAYALAAIQGRIALEYQKWSEAANLSLNNHLDFPWNNFPQCEALLYFAKGIGAGRSGNSEIIQQAYQKLEKLQNTFKDTEANKYWINQIEIQKTVVKAWQMFAQGNREKAIETMILAAELEDATEKNPVTPGELLPVREMLGDMLLEMDQPDEALLQYELALESSPNRFNSLYGAGRSAELNGDKNKAVKYFTTLLENRGSSDLSRERLVYASNVINGI
jgi:tetratricopeptide (TPR) repeat protein